MSTITALFILKLTIAANASPSYRPTYLPSRAEDVFWLTLIGEEDIAPTDARVLRRFLHDSGVPDAAQVYVYPPNFMGGNASKLSAELVEIHRPEYHSSSAISLGPVVPRVVWGLPERRFQWNWNQLLTEFQDSKTIQNLTGEWNYRKSMRTVFLSFITHAPAPSHPTNGSAASPFHRNWGNKTIDSARLANLIEKILSWPTRPQIILFLNNCYGPKFEPELDAITQQNPNRFTRIYASNDGQVVSSIDWTIASRDTIRDIFRNNGVPLSDEQQRALDYWADSLRQPNTASVSDLGNLSTGMFLFLGSLITVPPRKQVSRSTNYFGIASVRDIVNQMKNAKDGFSIHHGTTIPDLADPDVAQVDKPECFFIGRPSMTLVLDIGKSSSFEVGKLIGDIAGSLNQLQIEDELLLSSGSGTDACPVPRGEVVNLKAVEELSQTSCSRGVAAVRITCEHPHSLARTSLNACDHIQTPHMYCSNASDRQEHLQRWLQPAANVYADSAFSVEYFLILVDISGSMSTNDIIWGKSMTYRRVVARHVLDAATKVLWLKGLALLRFSHHLSKPKRLILQPGHDMARHQLVVDCSRGLRKSKPRSLVPTWVSKGTGACVEHQFVGSAGGHSDFTGIRNNLELLLKRKLKWPLDATHVVLVTDGNDTREPGAFKEFVRFAEHELKFHGLTIVLLEGTDPSPAFDEHTLERRSRVFRIPIEILPAAAPQQGKIPQEAAKILKRLHSWLYYLDRTPPSAREIPDELLDEAAISPLLLETFWKEDGLFESTP